MDINLRVSDITEDLIKTLKSHGAYRVFIGIETINKTSNLIMNKQQNVTNIQEKIDILKKYDIEFHASFIIGNPGDTIDDLEETISFVNKLSLHLLHLIYLNCFLVQKLLKIQISMALLLKIYIGLKILNGLIEF
jgi:radical SAM superfamily enzyme YgiQ (UPF0313 family)